VKGNYHVVSSNLGVLADVYFLVLGYAAGPWFYLSGYERVYHSCPHRNSLGSIDVLGPVHCLWSYPVVLLIVFFYILLCWLIPATWPILLPEEGYTAFECILGAHVCLWAAALVISLTFFFVGVIAWLL